MSLFVYICVSRDRLLKFPWRHLVLISFTQLQAAATVKKTNKQLFFGDKILGLESDCWKLGCVPMMRSLIRILRASLVQIDTEMAEKYSSQRYAVNWHWKICRKYQIFAHNRDFCLPHLYLTPSLGGFPSEYRHPVWYGKTRMVWLPDGEKISKICLFVLTWSTNVTDRQTDRQTDGHRMTA